MMSGREPESLTTETPPAPRPTDHGPGSRGLKIHLQKRQEEEEGKRGRKEKERRKGGEERDREEEGMRREEEGEKDREEWRREGGGRGGGEEEEGEWGGGQLAATIQVESVGGWGSSHLLSPPEPGRAQWLGLLGDSPAQELGLERGPGGAPGAQLWAAQGCGPGVVEHRQVLALLPQLVPFRLQDAHEHVHGDLDHVLPARALRGAGDIC